MKKLVADMSTIVFAMKVRPIGSPQDEDHWSFFFVSFDNAEPVPFLSNSHQSLAGVARRFYPASPPILSLHAKNCDQLACLSFPNKMPRLMLICLYAAASEQANSTCLARSGGH